MKYKLIIILTKRQTYTNYMLHKHPMMSLPSSRHLDKSMLNPLFCITQNKMSHQRNAVPFKCNHLCKKMVLKYCYHT